MRRSFALLLMLGLILTGCSLPQKDTKETPKAGTVRVLILGGSGMETSLVTAFKGANPGITVESVPFPDGDFKQVMEKLRSGETKVDVIIAPGNAFLFSQGVVSPLDDAAKRENIDLAGFGNALELGKYKEKLYGLPVSISPMVVVWNKDLFNKAGLKAPAAGWTWDEFDADARALAKVQAGKANAWGAAVPPWALADLFLTAGKGPVDPDMTAAQALLARFQKLEYTDKIMPVDPLADKDTEYYLAFARSELGMMLDYWEYSFGHAKPPEFAWSVAPFPGGAQVPAIATLAMLGAKAENPAAALAFIKFAAGPGGAQAVARMPGAPVPGYVNGDIQNMWLAHASLKEDASFLLRQHYLPTSEYPEELVPLMMQQFMDALAGKQTPEQAVQAYKQARDPIVSKK